MCHCFHFHRTQNVSTVQVSCFPPLRLTKLLCCCFPSGFYLISPSEFERFSMSTRCVVEPRCLVEAPFHLGSFNQHQSQPDGASFNHRCTHRFPCFHVKISKQRVFPKETDHEWWHKDPSIHLSSRSFRRYPKLMKVGSETEPVSFREGTRANY